MSYSFGEINNTPSPKGKSSETEKEELTTGNGCLDAILQAVGVVSLCILLLVCSCTYMGWKAVKRASDLISIPDRLFSEGQTENAVEQYKQIFPELVKPNDREKVLKRIISYEFSSGDEEEAAFWSDVAAEEGFDLRDDMGVANSPIRRMIERAWKRHQKRRGKIERNRPDQNNE